MTIIDEGWEEFVKKEYPLDVIESEINKIEQLGYYVDATEYQCLIWDGSKLLIDSDFFDDYHLNVASAIWSFYYD